MPAVVGPQSADKSTCSTQDSGTEHNTDLQRCRCWRQKQASVTIVDQMATMMPSSRNKPSLAATVCRASAPQSTVVGCCGPLLLDRMQAVVARKLARVLHVTIRSSMLTSKLVQWHTMYADSTPSSCHRWTRQRQVVATQPWTSWLGCTHRTPSTSRAELANKT